MRVPRVLGDLGRLLPRDGLLRAARWLGFVLIALAVAFMVRTLRGTWSGLAGWRPTPELIAVAAGGAVVWALAMHGLARAWVRLVAAFGSCEASERALWALYARIQIVRYSPGNAFQVGRHALARSAGVGHLALVAAALTEALALVAASAALALAALPRLTLPAGGLGPLAIAGIAVGGVLLPLVVVALGRRLLPLLALPRGRLPVLLTAWLASLALFLSGGIAFAALLVVQGTEPSAGFVAACASGFALAWLAGYLAPAAPEGVGVREAVLIAVLGPVAAPAQLLVAAVGVRVVAVAGDALLALAGLARSGSGRHLAELLPSRRPEVPETGDADNRGEAA